MQAHPLLTDYVATRSGLTKLFVLAGFETTDTCIAEVVETFLVF